jgi:hypothetical protein
MVTGLSGEDQYTGLKHRFTKKTESWRGSSDEKSRQTCLIQIWMSTRILQCMYETANLKIERHGSAARSIVTFLHGSDSREINDIQSIQEHTCAFPDSDLGLNTISFVHGTVIHGLPRITNDLGHKPCFGGRLPRDRT